MNPVWIEALRRNWRMSGALAALVVFTVIHFAWFKPAAARYQAALTSVGGIEAVFNPGGLHPMLPPRVFSLVTEHSLAPQDALDRGNSGALGVVLLEDLGRLANRSGLTIVDSDPGTVAQQSMSVQIRAHVTLHGRYSQIVAFFDEMASDSSLNLVDRFQITTLPDGSDELQIWVSRLYLKRAAS